MNKDLIKIKKRYGEKMMHLCSSLFPTILEYDGLLFNLLSSLFSYNKYLYDDIYKYHLINEFQEYILGFFDNYNCDKINTSKTPYELLDEAGYNLYYCQSESDVKKFRKYYHTGEELCTFYMNRTKDHYVFFAVKKDVKNIKRSKFKNPMREDMYGTSVISIQFNKGDFNVVSIKNRYNHIVNNPDATFSNNLDNIIPGLTDSFEKAFNLNIFASKTILEIPGYCYGKNGKLYKYNRCIYDTYYCPNNVIVSKDKLIEYEKEKYIIADYFIIDLVNKKIKLFDEELTDSFAIDEHINKIIVKKVSTDKMVYIYGNDFYIELKLDNYNQIISYKSNLKEIKDNFLSYNESLKFFSNSEVKYIGNNFLTRNKSLEKIDIPNIEEVGDMFLDQCTKLDNISFPHLKKTGSYFLRSASLKELILPNLEIAGQSFLSYNYVISSIFLPKLQEAGDYFLNNNCELRELNLPNLETVGKCFMTKNKCINSVYLPRLKYIKSSFLEGNQDLISIDLPNALDINNHFLSRNIYLEKLNLPKVVRIGDCFLRFNEHLKIINIPNVMIIGNSFLESNNKLESIILPNVIEIKDKFLYSNIIINKAIMPNLKCCGTSFLYSAENIDYDFSSLENADKDFLYAYKRTNKENILVKKR